MDLLNSNEYQPISLIMVHLLEFLISELSSDNYGILSDFKVEVLVGVYQRHYTELKRVLLLRSIDHILRQLCRFGHDMIQQLTQGGVLEFLLTLQHDESMDSQPIYRSNEILDLMYGGREECIHDLSFHQIFQLVDTTAPFAVLRGLEELERRIPDLLEQINPVIRNPQSLQRAMSLLSLSYRRSMSSCSVFSRSQSGEDESEEEPSEVFENDFLSRSQVYTKNREKGMESAMKSIQESEYRSNSAAIKHLSREALHSTHSDSSQSAVTPTSSSESLLYRQYAEMTESLSILHSVLTRAGNLAYPTKSLSLQYSILRRLAQVLRHYCDSERLCDQLWRDLIIKDLFAAVGYAKSKKTNASEQRVADDGSFYAIGCALLTFFRRFQGDISDLWHLNDKENVVTLKILRVMMESRDASEETRALYILIAATVLRCPQLRSDFLSVVDLSRLVQQIDLSSPFLMESTAYLLGLENNE